MNSEELRELRKQIKKEKSGNEKLKQLILEKEELEKDQRVQRYIELCNMNVSSRKVYSSDEEIISKIIYHKDFKDTNNILVYLGTYVKSYEIGPSIDYTVKRDDSRADYCLYADVENLCRKSRVKIEDRELFEQAHNNIIYPEGYLKSELFNEYYKLKHEFIMDCLENGQKKAVTRLRKKCK